MMPERHVYDRLELLVDGQLARGEEQAVRSHLAKCAGCRHSYQMALAIPAHLGPGADPEAPGGLLVAVMARVAQTRRRRAITVLLAAAISAVATVSMALTVLAGPAGIAGLLPAGILTDNPLASSPEPTRHPEVAGVPALGQFQPLPAPGPSITKSPGSEPQQPAATASPEVSPSPDPSPTPTSNPTPTPSPSPSPTPNPSPTPSPCVEKASSQDVSGLHGPAGQPVWTTVGQVRFGGCPSPNGTVPPPG